MTHTDDLYTQILADGPSPKTVFLLLSKWKKEGHLRRVIQESLKALNAYPNDIHIRRLLAQTYFEAGLISQAEAELDKVGALIGDLTDAYRLQAQIYMQQKRRQEAARSLELYLAHRPDDQEALDFLATLTPGEDAPAQEELQPPAEEIPAKAEEQEIVEDASASDEAPSEIATPTQAEIYEEKELDDVRQKKERMIAILESWLGNIREQFSTARE